MATKKYKRDELLNMNITSVRSIAKTYEIKTAKKTKAKLISDIMRKMNAPTKKPIRRAKTKTQLIYKRRFKTKDGFSFLELTLATAQKVLKDKRIELFMYDASSQSEHLVNTQRDLKKEIKDFVPVVEYSSASKAYKTKKSEAKKTASRKKTTTKKTTATKRKTTAKKATRNVPTLASCKSPFGCDAIY